jgi:hypothetical protein
MAAVWGNLPTLIDGGLSAYVSGTYTLVSHTNTLVPGTTLYQAHICIKHILVLNPNTPLSALAHPHTTPSTAAGGAGTNLRLEQFYIDGGGPGW